jgi:hypothetical protein
MKHFAELVSVDMGMRGVITDVVLREAQRRLDNMNREAGEIQLPLIVDVDVNYWKPLDTDTALLEKRS